MSLTYHLKKLTLSGGNEIAFSPDSITVIVGPNNSGKSRLLQEIVKFIQQGAEPSKPHRKVLLGIEVAFNGNEQEFIEHVKQHSESFLDESGNQVHRGLNFNATEGTIKSRWSDKNSGFHESIHLICTHATTLERLTISNSANSINRLKETPTHPIQMLYANEDVEKKLCDYFQVAFGVDLVLHRGAGSRLPLYVGKKPSKRKGEDRVSTSYLQRLEKLDLIEEQGDGVRSFAGCLLTTLVNPRFIALLDEPEAFLHPPQARLLGSILGKENNNQIIISTHSSDFLMGILDQTPHKLNIIRLTRAKNKNYAIKLDPEDIKRFWSDPILRFSKILDGLFHEQIVICESDVDCRFYSAVLDAIFDKRDGSLIRKPDVFFTYSGGKGRVSTIVKSLLKIKMPTKAIVDFDILFDKQQFSILYNSLGGRWDRIQMLYQQVIDNIQKIDSISENLSPILCIKEIIDAAQDKNYLSEQDKSKIKDILKPPSSIKLAKIKGMNIFKEESEINACSQLIKECQKVGLWIVSGGEMESFDPSTNGKSGRWVEEILKKDLLQVPELDAAREFIAQVIAINISR